MPTNLTMTGATFSGNKLTAGYGITPVGYLTAKPFTISCRFTTTNTTGVKVLIGQKDVFWLGINAGKIMVDYTNHGTVNTTTVVNDGLPHTVDVVITASTVRVWIDGIYVNGATGLSGTSNFTTFPLGIGNFGGEYQYTFAGSGNTFWEAAIWNIEKWTTNANHTVPDSIDHFDTGLLGLWHLATDGNDSAGVLVAGQSVTILPNNPFIKYSPLNWDISALVAISINSGAKFALKFTGNACALSFDVSTASGVATRLWYRFDGYGPKVEVSVAASVSLVIPTILQTATSHYLEVWIKSQGGGLRWSTLQTAVKLTGIIIAPDQVALDSFLPPLKIGFLADSIGEGVRTVAAGASDVDNNDATQSWCYHLGHQLGAQVGMICVSNQGYTVGGLGGTPKLSLSYNLNYAGSNRVFPSDLNAMVILEGHNDGSDITTDATTVFNGLLAATPSTCLIFVLRPLAAATRAAQLQAAIAATTNPSRLIYINTDGFWSSTDSFDAVHPWGYSNMTDIAPKIAAVIRPYLSASKIGFRKMYK